MNASTAALLVKAMDLATVAITYFLNRQAEVSEAEQVKASINDLREKIVAGELTEDEFKIEVRAIIDGQLSDLDEAIERL